MNGVDFVEALKIAVREPAVSGTLSVLENPPGRMPTPELSENAAWYASLSEDDRRKLFSVVKHGVDQAIFGFLCVLDGVRAIESQATKGRLELRYLNSEITILNPPNGEMLHELF